MVNHNGEKMFLKKEKIVIRDMGDEAVLYNPQTKSIHVLNKTSSMVWQYCDGKHSLKMIENKIMETFDVSNAQDVKDDIIETLNQFSQLGLIEQ
jgi:hypothetical protein